MSDDQEHSDKSSFRLPVAGVMRLKFNDFDGFVNRLGRGISQAGIFLPTSTPKPGGTIMALTISTKDGTPILTAEGEVLWARRSSDANKPSGMAFRFIHLDDKSRELVWKLAKLNHEAGIEPVVVNEHEDEQQATETASAAEAKPEAVDSAETAPEEETAASAASPIEPPAVQRGAGLPLTEPTGPVIGIDFGTTNCCVGIMTNNKAQLIPSDRGSLIIPSVISINDQGKVLIGQPAKEQLLINPQNTVYGAKRFIGRNFRSPFVRESRDRFSYAMKAGPSDEVIIELAGKDYTVPEIGSFVFASLREYAEGMLQTTTNQAVVTVPAYYTENQRAAIKEAANLAGFHVKLLLNEPTAASLVYGFDREFEKNVLVFDLGGGTFDVSVLEISNNVFEVKGTGGDPFLGGMDFDQRLIDFVVNTFEKKNKVKVRDNHTVMQRIASGAENAKIQLSFQDETEILLPFLVEKRGKPIDLKMTITREQLNDLTSDLVDRTLELCDKAIHAMGVLPDNIDEVLLVGGQTRMPLIQQKVTDFFNKEPKKGVHPDEAVALGAAVLGGSLAAIDGPLLLDVLSQPIGLALPGGRFKPIFEKHMSLPAKKTYSFSDLQSKQLTLYQGIGDTVAENEYIGDIDLDQPGFQDAEDVSIEFSLSREGIMDVAMKNNLSGEIDTVSLEWEKSEELEMPEVVEEQQGSEGGLLSKFFGK